MRVEMNGDGENDRQLSCAVSSAADMDGNDPGRHPKWNRSEVLPRGQFSPPRGPAASSVGFEHLCGYCTAEPAGLFCQEQSSGAGRVLYTNG